MQELIIPIPDTLPHVHPRRGVHASSNVQTIVLRNYDYVFMLML
jgi:hypothetical protein